MSGLLFEDDADRDDPVVQAFIARIPEVRAGHAAIGLTDEESWATLQDLPRRARGDRMLHGTPGLRSVDWIERIWDGHLVELGRLQFEDIGDGVFEVHIPEGGPLEPALLDRSYARARELFPGHHTVIGRSWLFDPVLAELLPPTSNIVLFQKRFERFEPWQPANADVLRHVFRTTDPNLDRLEASTSLERVLLERMRAGGEWLAPGVKGSLEAMTEWTQRMQLRFEDDADRDDPLVQAYIARIPEVRARHAALGLTDEESWETIQDLPRKVARDRNTHGPGLRSASWIDKIWSGTIVQLGVGQFEDVGHGVLKGHLPAGGAFSPPAVDATLERARRIFPRHHSVVVKSWVLDPALAERLPPRSNIARFQKRFEFVELGHDANRQILRYVFETAETDLGKIVPKGGIQRVLLAHMRAGGSWRIATGVLSLR